VTPLPEKLGRTLGVLEALERTERIQTLVDIAGHFRSVPLEIASRPYPDDHRVPGCESEAYVWAEANPNGTLNYHFAVENPQGISAMALASILRTTLSGVPLDEVAAVPPDMIYRIFGRELSMGKSLGLMGMVSMVRAAAQARLHAEQGRN
jgi:cysteine desulfuration protein SufE